LSLADLLEEQHPHLLAAVRRVIISSGDGQPPYAGFSASAAALPSTAPEGDHRPTP
jgi:FXSXX-COOH protein